MFSTCQTNVNSELYFFTYCKNLRHVWVSTTLMIDLMRLGNEGVCTEYTEKCRYCQQCKVNSHCAKLLVLVREDKLAGNSRKVNGYTYYIFTVLRIYYLYNKLQYLTCTVTHFHIIYVSNFHNCNIGMSLSTVLDFYK